ncbi:MAG: hypothetical protein GY895_05585 [Phycisphaera sp.]|nr:hypothetical protein [Phycisphaera sp.]
MHAHTHHDVADLLESILAGGKRWTAGAVCYFTDAGRQLIDPWAVRRNIAKDGGFLVIGGATPTDLDAILKLHQENKSLAGHIFIHWGVMAPIATDTAKFSHSRRPLMHSKVFVAATESRTTVWTGSHNLTSSAIKGANVEAATVIEGDPDEQWAIDARSHLEACRDEAELFDPSKMDEYRRRQGTPGEDPEAIRRHKCLVIHALGELATERQFRIHVKVCTDRFDRSFANDMPVRLFIHPNEPENPEDGVDFDQAKCWAGCVTGVNRGRDHATNPGITGDYVNADYEVLVLDGASIPRIARVADPPAGQAVHTQVTARLDRERDIGTEVFSNSPMSRTVDLAPRETVLRTGIRLGAFAKFFTGKKEEPPEELNLSLVQSSRRTFKISGDDVITDGLLSRFRDRSRPQDLELEIDTSSSEPDSNAHLFYVAKSYISLIDVAEDDCRGSAQRP